MPLSAGARLGPYEIIGPLGSGGMGEVYAAFDPRLRRRVALKILPPALANDPARRERFEREAQTIAALTHPSIVTIYSVEEADAVPFLTMEFVEGQPLSALVPPDGFALDRLLQIAIPVADAMSAAHARGITHRDLKPANIMVTPDGRVKVLDFGLAKLKEDATPAALGATALPTQALTGEGHIVGTVAYMAPEQAEGKPVDPRADIFALGVILYELATGERPFQGDSTASLLSSLLRDTPVLVTDRRPELPRELARVIRRCLEKDPARRLQPALDLRNELEEIKATAAPLPMPVSIVTASTVGSAPSRGELPASDTALLAAVARRHKGTVLSVTALVLAGVLAFMGQRWWSGRATVSVGSIESVAVLPFVNASGSPDADYLSEGVTETLTNNLAQIRALRVVPRTLAAKYKNKAVDPQQAGRDLNVRAVVTGQVVQRGDRLQIQVELIDVVSVAQLWGERLDRSLSDALSMQAEISKSIVDKLRLRLTGDDEKGLAAGGTQNAEAYQLYLKGRYEWNKRSREGLSTGAQYFEQAIRSDPSYALAYAGLANAYNMRAFYGFLPSSEAFPKAIAAVRKAVELDERSADAHAALGWSSLRSEWNWTQSEREFQRALALDPNNATAHQWHGTVPLTRGRYDEAIAECRRGEALDPLSPGFALGSAYTLTFAHRYDEAIETLKRALELEPNFATAHRYLAGAYRLKGMTDLAIAESRRAVELRDPIGQVDLAASYAASGRKGEAVTLLKGAIEESKRSRRGALDIALILVALGEGDQAFAWLEEAYKEHDQWLPFLNVNPEFAALRDDPRFRDLVRRIGIPAS